jgi:hypothetical protein
MIFENSLFRIFLVVRGFVVCGILVVRVIVVDEIRLGENGDRRHSPEYITLQLRHT